MEKKPRILVVGSFVMDQIVTTECFPRPGQTVLAKTFRKAPGGKGANQAVQMARLGADVTLFGKLGRDSNGQELLDACREAGVRTDLVRFDAQAASGCAVIVLEEREGQPVENRILVIPGANGTITAQEVAFLQDSIDQYDMVVLQLEIPMEINVLVARYAHSKGVPVLLNPAPSAVLPKELLSCLTCIAPNEQEVQDLTGIRVGHGETKEKTDAAKAAAAALQKLGVPRVLITLGAFGAVLAQGDAFYCSPAVQNVQAVDPTAAGDSFIGAFCVAVCEGMPPEDAMRFANNAAALTVSKMGAMPSLPDMDEVKAAMRG